MLGVLVYRNARSIFGINNLINLLAGSVNEFLLFHANVTQVRLLGDIILETNNINMLNAVCLVKDIVCQAGHELALGIINIKPSPRGAINNFVFNNFANNSL